MADGTFAEPAIMDLAAKVELLRSFAGSLEVVASTDRDVAKCRLAAVRHDLITGIIEDLYRASIGGVRMPAATRPIYVQADAHAIRDKALSALRQGPLPRVTLLEVTGARDRWQLDGAMRPLKESGRVSSSGKLYRLSEAQA